MLKKIPVEQLAVGMFLHGVDQSWLTHSLWRTRFVIEDEESLQRVRASGITECWIDPERGADVPETQVEQILVAAPAVPIVVAAPQSGSEFAAELERASQVRARAAAVMRDMYAEVRMGKALDPEQCGPLVDDVVASIDRNPDALITLMRLKNADEYTYLHSVAVCALMVALGRQLGFDETRCRDAGMAGMLHDLGKALMPQEVLNKPGRLTPEEFAIIRTHPVRGHELLLEAGTDNEVVLDVCRHHHERVDGKGYPDGLPPEQISLLARMGAVCDVYDAVTSARCYKPGWDPSQAVAQMATWRGHFDPTVFQCFVRSVGIYPTGSLVRMLSGRLGVVVAQNAASLTRPMVKLFYSTRAQAPLRPQLLDLSDPSVGDQIEGRELPENWHFDHLNELWGGDAALKLALQAQG